MGFEKSVAKDTMLVTGRGGNYTNKIKKTQDKLPLRKTDTRTLCTKIDSPLRDRGLRDISYTQYHFWLNDILRIHTKTRDN